MQSQKSGLGLLFCLVAIIGVPAIYAALIFSWFTSLDSGFGVAVFLLVGLVFFVKGLFDMLDSKKLQILICMILGAIYVVVMGPLMLLLTVFFSRD